MEKDYEPKEDIEVCRTLVSVFKNNLPNRVDPASLTWESKIPWKAMLLRETLLYRITELGESAIELYQKEDRIIPSFLISRAVQETTALYYFFFEKLEQVANDRFLGDFDKDLMKMLFGCRSDARFPSAFNILTAVDKLDKFVNTFRANYDLLSEFCHPNYSGVLGAYAKINHETAWVDLGTEERKISPQIGLSSLVVSLKLFTHFYNESADLIPVLIEICEHRE